MKILYIELDNFIGIKAAMKTTHVKFVFGDIDKPIIQIYGPNHCGKTVLAHLLHPFANINFTGDERNDLSLIIPGETGMKQIGYEANGHLYNITHTYTPTKTSHSISSSILKDGEELNPSKGVNTFNLIINQELSINKYIFQFIINGTQLTNMGTMSDTQRKNAMYKAMGIDIYNTIHKMATDDYRYTNKIITALSNSREFLLADYGTYENLCTRLEMKRTQHKSLSVTVDKFKNRMAELEGKISTLKSQNIYEELSILNNTIASYDSVISQLGEVSVSMGDDLVNEQIKINEDISNIRSTKAGLIKDRDILFSKRDDIQNTIRMNQKAITDYQELKQMKEDLVLRVKAMPMYQINTSPSYLSNMLNLAMVVNSTSKEIITCLNDKLLNTMCDMLINDISVENFLIREGATLKDSESEKAAVHRLHNILNGVAGEIDICDKNGCLYRNSYNMMQKFFESYQSTDPSSYTAYDIEQLEMAYKGIQSIRKIISVQIADECKELFTMKMIAENLKRREYGIDVTIINELIEHATSEETRLRLIKQISDIERNLESMNGLLFKNGEVNEQEAIQTINNEIANINENIANCDSKLIEYNNSSEINKSRRTLYASIRNINIGEVRVRFSKLSKLAEELRSYENEYSTIFEQFHSADSDLNRISVELKKIEDAYNQYANNVSEIEKHLEKDKRYKIISEATSSTKGKPVLSIREKVNSALSMTNRLLDVMYDGEMEMLKPIIDESTFALPFRSGTNKLSDIRYGSQSENTLLSLAFDLSIALSLTDYNIPIIDELDAFLDAEVSDSFLTMINEIMNTLKMEQLFIISHKVQPGQYSQFVHTFNLIEEI